MAKATTLLEVCVAAAGGRYRDVRRGMRAFTFVVEWAWASYDGHDGEPISTYEFAAYWGTSDRNAWKRKAGFHDVFPARDPNDIAQILVRAWRERGVRKGKLDRVAVGSVSIDPGELVPA